MEEIFLTRAAKNYIEAYGNDKIFSIDDGQVSVDRRLPQQKTINLSSIEKTLNTHFLARDGETIRSRIYIPKHDGQELPVIVYFHGGGWVLGDIDYMDGGCQYLSHFSKAIVISIEYRLAPEYAYPTPLYDAYDGLLWAVKNDLHLPINFAAISVAGDSAGGNLAAAVSALTIELNGPKLLSQLLIYPALDATTKRASYDHYGEGFGLNKYEMNDYYEHYIQQRQDFHHFTVSPLLFTNKKLLPPTIIISAQYDVLNDEAAQYIADLQAYDIVTEHHILPGLIHSYFSKMDYFEVETADTTKRLARFMLTQLNTK